MATGKGKEESEDIFCSRISDTVLSGFTLAGLSLGVKLGLFDVLGSCTEPVTSDQLAVKCNYKERYVREWLHHMVMCDIVEVDEEGTHFSLPEHRLKALTDSSQLLPTMGVALPYLLLPHQDIIACFRQDGPIGLPYETVMPFFEERCCRNSESLKRCADYLRDVTPGAKEQMAEGVKVLEVGSGSGTMLLHMASQFPKTSFHGVDLSESLMTLAKKSLAEKQLTNVKLYFQDATELPEEWIGHFDIVFIRDVLHDIAHVSKALACIYRCLKPGGILSLLEVNLNRNPYKSKQDPQKQLVGKFAYIISTYHCLPASMYTPGSAGLGAGSGVETFTQLLEEAGFLVEGPTGSNPADMFNTNFVCKKPL